MTVPLRTGDPVVVNVALGERSTTFVIGRGILASLGQRIAALRRARKSRIVSDETVASHTPRAALAATKRAGLATATIVVPPGEASKSFGVFERVCDELLTQRIERGDLVLALGGGVIGDLAGFAASVVRAGSTLCRCRPRSSRRSISSVGAKTAIDSRHGKT